MKKLVKQLFWQNFAMLFLAGCINAFGVTVFLAPVKLYDSGISGTSILLSQLTGLPLSVFLLLLNVPPLPIAPKFPPVSYCVSGGNPI